LSRYVNADVPCAVAGETLRGPVAAAASWRALLW
jgi:hypothetical protein